MKVLIVGAGVIGTVYGAHLAADGHPVSVLSHPPRTADVASHGFTARDVLTDSRVESQVSVVGDAAGSYDMVLVAVRRDQLASACARVTDLRGEPAVLFFGNNPGGRAALAGLTAGQPRLGFPGIGGVLTGRVAEYVRIPQQPTALENGGDPRLAEFAAALTRRGFAVQRVDDMAGWLAYHGAFIACVAAALERCGIDPVRLAGDRRTLTLMCRAVTEAFSALRSAGTGGLPRNLAVLHSRPLQPLAVRYWARTMRSPMGELAFAAHTRHASAEMRALGADVAAAVAGSPAVGHLSTLLRAGQAPARRG